MVIITRKHIPRKKSDVNIIRCILLNINDKIDTTYQDYEIDNTHFLLMIDALNQNRIVSLIKGKDKYHTNSYSITDVVKYNEWSKSNFYRHIELYVIPFLEFGTEVLDLASKYNNIP